MLPFSVLCNKIDSGWQFRLGAASVRVPKSFSDIVDKLLIQIIDNVIHTIFSPSASLTASYTSSTFSGSSLESSASPSLSHLLQLHLQNHPRHLHHLLQLHLQNHLLHNHLHYPVPHSTVGNLVHCSKMNLSYGKFTILHNTPKQASFHNFL